MPVSTCTRCHQLYDAGSREAADEPDRLCGDCVAAERAPEAYVVVLACLMDDIPAGVWGTSWDACRQARRIAADPGPALAASPTGNRSEPVAVHVLQGRGADWVLLETLEVETKETSE